jgi:hypothetical protein
VKAHHKFGAVRTVQNGTAYASKAEAAYAAYLEQLRQAGQLVGVMEQPTFRLPGGTRYVADFLCFWADGTVDARDVKGMETEGFKIKWKEVQHAYPWMTFLKVKRSGKAWAVGE